MRPLLTLVLLVIASLACATPGSEVSRQPGDFALLQVDLAG